MAIDRLIEKCASRVTLERRGSDEIVVQFFPQNTQIEPRSNPPYKREAEAIIATLLLLEGLNLQSPARDLRRTGRAKGNDDNSDFKLVFKSQYPDLALTQIEAAVMNYNSKNDVCSPEVATARSSWMFKHQLEERYSDRDIMVTPPTS